MGRVWRKGRRLQMAEFKEDTRVQSHPREPNAGGPGGAGVTWAGTFAKHYRPF